MYAECYGQLCASGGLSEVWRADPEAHSRFKQNNELYCPCGTTINLATDELIAIIGQLEGALGRLIRPAPEG
jgi:hypothetical protein